MATVMRVLLPALGALYAAWCLAATVRGVLRLRRDRGDGGEGVAS